MGKKLLCTLVRKVSPGLPKTDVVGLQTLHKDKFGIWASNYSIVEEIWNHLKDRVSKSIERFFPHKLHRKPPYPE